MIRTLLLVTAFVASYATAQINISPPNDDSSTIDTSPPISIVVPAFHFHRHALALGFGTNILSQSSDVYEWKKVDAFWRCDDDDAVPDLPDNENPVTDDTSVQPPPTPVDPIDPIDPVDPVDPVDPIVPIDPIPIPPPPPSVPDAWLLCWDVKVTTGYDFVVCPDGRAVVNRNGIGVSLTGRDSGDEYAWAEVGGCGGTIIDDGSTIDDSTGVQKINSKDPYRPLELKRIQRDR